MRKSFLHNVILFAFLLVSQNLQAQADSTKKASDSINTALLSDYNKKLLEIDQQRINDSVKRVELEEQLKNYKTTDNLRKEELQQQLRELNEKENRRIADKKRQIDSLRLTARSFPVYGFFNDTLFLIYSKLGSFSARDRAAAIDARIQNLADHFRFHPDSIIITESETTADLSYGETIIMSISENDAIWNNTTKIDLAETYKKSIGEAVLHYKKETSFSTLAKEIGLALLVLTIMILLIIYLSRFSKWLAKKIQAQEGKAIKGLTLKNYTLFDAGRLVNVLLLANKALKWLLILVTIYIALPVLFGIFPWTKDFADTLFGYILDPLKKIGNGIWNYLPKLFTIIVIVFVFHYVLKGIYFLKTEIEKGKLNINGFYQDWANPTYQIIKIILYAFMGVLVWPYLPGSSSPVFQGVSVFLGVLFTFGSSGSLSNMIAGLVLTYMRLFKIGDRVKIGEVTGDVIEKSLLVTRVRTIKNELISIPNSSVMSSHTINYSSDAEDRGLILHTTVTIGYDVPWKAMHTALLAAADRTELILKEPKPFVLQTSLDDFFVSYQVNGYTRDPNRQAWIYSELHGHIQDCCNEAGIEILSPHYRAARDGNSTTIPENYRDKNYKAPGFNLNIKNNNS